MPCTVLQAQGSRGLLGYVEEQTWGTQPAANKTWTGLRFNREGIGKDIDLFESQEIRSDRMVAAILRGNQKPDGEFSFEFGPNSHNLLLRHGMGDYWRSVGAASPYNLYLQGGDLPCGGLTFVKGFADIPRYLVYTGGRVDSLSFEFPQEGIVTGTARMLFKDEAAMSSSAPYNGSLTYPTGDPYEANQTQAYVIAYDSTMSSNNYWANVTGASWGTVLGIVTGGRFTISNSVDGNSFVIGSTSRYSLPYGRRRIEGSMNILFVDETHYTRYINGTALALRIKFYNPNTTYYHDFFFPNIRYAGARATPVIEGEGGVKYDIPFRAIRHENVGTDIICHALADQFVVNY